MLDTKQRGKVAAVTAVAGGSLAAVTIGMFATTGTSNASFTPGCGYGYDAGYGYGYGYGSCPSPSPSPSKAASPSPTKAAGSPTAVPTPSATASPTPVKVVPATVKLDGGSIKKGQRKGITARGLRPNRIVQVYAIQGGKSTRFVKETVNKFGTIRVFYRAKATGKVTISFVGADFQGKTIRKKFTTTVKPS